MASNNGGDLQEASGFGATAGTPCTPELFCDTLSLTSLYLSRDQESLIQELETGEPGCVGMVIR